MNAQMIFALTLIYAFFLHFVADFLLQSREMGKKKSSEFKFLAAHLAIQYLVLYIGLIPVLGFHSANMISLANMTVHGLIDWNIWNMYKLHAHNRLRKSAHSDALDMPDWSVPYEKRFADSYAKRLKDFQYWEDHWFYATIGLDQFLHIATLTALMGLLIK